MKSFREVPNVALKSVKPELQGMVQASRCATYRCTPMYKYILSLSLKSVLCYETTINTMVWTVVISVHKSKSLAQYVAKIIKNRLNRNHGTRLLRKIPFYYKNSSTYTT